MTTHPKTESMKATLVKAAEEQSDNHAAVPIYDGKGKNVAWTRSSDPKRRPINKHQDMASRRFD